MRFTLSQLQMAAIQTALREWAYACAYDTSDQHVADLPICRSGHIYTIGSTGSSSLSAKIKATNQPVRPGTEQPIEVPLLEYRS